MAGSGSGGIWEWRDLGVAGSGSSEIREWEYGLGGAGCGFAEYALRWLQDLGVVSGGTIVVEDGA